MKALYMASAAAFVVSMFNAAVAYQENNDKDLRMNARVMIASLAMIGAYLYG